MWLDPSEWAKNMTVIGSHVTAHQKAISAERYFNNPVDRMACSVDTSQRFSTASPSSPSELMNKVAMVAGTEVMCGLSNVDCYSPRPTWLWPLLSACLLAAETSSGSLVQNHYWDDQLSTWWQVDHIRSLPSCFIIIRIDTIYMALPTLYAVLLENDLPWIGRKPYPPTCYATQPCFQSKISLHIK